MAEFGSLWKEIDTLGQLVKAATRAASTAGQTMPVPPKLSTVGESGPKMVSLFASDESMLFKSPYSLWFVYFLTLLFLPRASKKTPHLKSKCMDWLRITKPHSNLVFMHGLYVICIQVVLHSSRT